MSAYVQLLANLRKSPSRERELAAADVIELLLTQIEDLKIELEESDRLWTSAEKREIERFAKLRKDLGLPESRVDKEDPE